MVGPVHFAPDGRLHRILLLFVKPTGTIDSSPVQYTIDPAVRSPDFFDQGRHFLTVRNVTAVVNVIHACLLVGGQRTIDVHRPLDRGPLLGRFFA